MTGRNGNGNRGIPLAYDVDGAWMRKSNGNNNEMKCMKFQPAFIFFRLHEFVICYLLFVICYLLFNLIECNAI